MPSSHSTRRENAGRSLSPRFSLRCKTIARSLIFAPRRRLFRSSFLRNYRSFSHFCSAEAASAAFSRHFSLKNPRYHRGFFASMPSSHSARRENASRSLAPRFSLRCKTIALSLIFAPRRRLPPLFQGNFCSKPTVSPWVSCIYAFLSLCASRKYYFASRGECCYPRLPYGLSSPVQNKLPHSQNAGLTFSLYKNF